MDHQAPLRNDPTAWLEGIACLYASSDPKMSVRAYEAFRDTTDISASNIAGQLSSIWVERILGLQKGKSAAICVCWDCLLSHRVQIKDLYEFAKGRELQWIVGGHVEAIPSLNCHCADDSVHRRRPFWAVVVSDVNSCIVSVRPFQCVILVCRIRVFCRCLLTTSIKKQ